MWKVEEGRDKSVFRRDRLSALSLSPYATHTHTQHKTSRLYLSVQSYFFFLFCWDCLLSVCCVLSITLALCAMKGDDDGVRNAAQLLLIILLKRNGKGERFEEQVRTLDSSRHLGFWTLMEVVGGWWLWFVADREEREEGRTHSVVSETKQNKNAKEKKSNRGRESLRRRKCARARVFYILRGGGPSPLLVFDVTQDETQEQQQQQLLVHFFFIFQLLRSFQKVNDKEAEEYWRA